MLAVIYTQQLQPYLLLLVAYFRVLLMESQLAVQGVLAAVSVLMCMDVHGCTWMCMDVHPVHAVRSMKAQRKHQEGLAQVRAGWSLGVLSMALKPLSVLQS